MLTAWAAGKFSGASVAAFCREIGLEERVERREIVIPGYAAQIDPEDRWAITAYVRALQLSRNATIDDVPASERAVLKK